MPQKIDVSEEMWMRLKMEYISSDISFRGLEKKYGIPFSQIQKKAKRGSWTELKDETKSKSLQKSVDLIAEHQAEECTRAFRVANTVLLKIEEYVNSIDLKDDYAMKNLKTVTSAIKDLKEIGLFRSALDKAEQEARIKKLQKDAEEEDKDMEIIVSFKDDVDKYSN